jgi:8-oxo-dGTP pyrophosphatase MutT (NUDIX family)
MPYTPRRQRIAVLLARGAPHLTVAGRWFLPGGGVDHGEHPEAALRREFVEETGLAVDVGPLYRILSDQARLPDGTDLHTVRLIYRIDAHRGRVRAEAVGSTDDARWFTMDQALALPLMPYVRTVLSELGPEPG